MKGLIVLLELAFVSLVLAYETQCPPEQEIDWEIEQLLRHEDCNKFWKCTFGSPVEYTCPNDLYFNLETWQCDWQHNVDCTDRNIPDPVTTTLEPTTPEPTTTTTTTTTPAPTTTTTTTTTPAPTTTTTTTTTPAPTTTTTTTTTTPAPTTTTTTTTTPAPDPEFLPNGCPINPHVHWLLPHETDCNLFYYCVWGEKVLRNCPSVLHFNRVIQVCDWPSDAGCTTSFNKHLNSRLALMAH